MQNFHFLNTQQLYFEGKAARKTGNSIGYGLIVFVGFVLCTQIICTYLVLSGVLSESLANDPLFNTVYSTIVSLVGFLGGGILIIKSEHRKIGDVISYEPPQSGDAYTLIIIGVGACLAASYVVGIFASVCENFGFEPKQPDAGTPDGVFGFIAYLLMVSVIPAICEEFIFHGAIMQSLRKFGDMTALVVSTILFALMHANLIQIPFALVAGFVMGYAALKTDSLIVPMLIHFCNNFIATMFNYVASTTGSAVVEYLLMLLEFAIIAAAILLAVKYIKKHGFLRFSPQAQISSPASLRARIVFAPAMIPFLCYAVLNVISIQMIG
ncbi:MAG: CPBP family intramembrane metalloprotease [Oscillospiraceae bacterium]|nr:CPBP family intramembrane metalloprotease [Candidatus Equicaccousia limihippi]